MGRRGGGGRRGGFGARRGISSSSHHHGRFRGGGGGGPTFPTNVDETWTNKWDSGLFSCSRYPMFCLEAWCCYYCAMQKVANVLQKPDWAETDSCCGMTCCMSCLFDVCVYGTGTPIFGGKLRCGVLNRYEIGGEGSCASCMTACCCSICSVNQMLNQLTLKGEYPGKVLCGSRPSESPPRPPPKVTAMGAAEQQLLMQMGGNNPQFQQQQMMAMQMGNDPQVQQQQQQMLAMMMNGNNNGGVNMTMMQPGVPMAGGMNNGQQQQQQYYQQQQSSYQSPHQLGSNDPNDMAFGVPPPPPPPPGSSSQQQPMPGFVGW